MPKQTIEEKAKSYIADGKISILLVNPVARVAHLHAQGTRSQPYNMHFTEGGWVCDCPAIVNGHRECAHIVAAKILVPGLRPSASPTIGTKDADLDEFLSGIVCYSKSTGKPGEDFDIEEL